MSQLVLIRGLPGSGKSTFAKAMCLARDGWVHREADMYFYQGGRIYRFDARRLPEAHLWCQDATRELLRDGYNVVVSNTFTQRWEMKPYIDMAKELGVSLHVVEMSTQYQNVHGVPTEVLQRMSDNWETYKSE
jgi:predicted kinase